MGINPRNQLLQQEIANHIPNVLVEAIVAELVHLSWTVLNGFWRCAGEMLQKAILQKGPVIRWAISCVYLTKLIIHLSEP